MGRRDIDDLPLEDAPVALSPVGRAIASALVLLEGLRSDLMVIADWTEKCRPNSEIQRAIGAFAFDLGRLCGEIVALRNLLDAPPVEKREGK